jgi:hypothetical protein
MEDYKLIALNGDETGIKPQSERGYKRMGITGGMLTFKSRGEAMKYVDAAESEGYTFARKTLIASRIRQSDIFAYALDIIFEKEDSSGNVYPAAMADVLRAAVTDLRITSAFPTALNDLAQTMREAGITQPNRSLMDDISTPLPSKIAQGYLRATMERLVNNDERKAS